MQYEQHLRPQPHRHDLRPIAFPCHRRHTGRLSGRNAHRLCGTLPLSCPPRAGSSPLSTARREADAPEFLCGLADGVTCGAPLTALIRNTDIRPQDYTALQNVPRPGHADYTASVRYGGHQDRSGGGQFSGRLTAPLCVAGGLCLQFLARRGVRISARIVSIGSVCDEAPFDASVSEKPFPVVTDGIGEDMQRAIVSARNEGDSLGGVIECRVDGLPAGLGAPMFDGMENRISQIVFAVPAVKGIEFGAGLPPQGCAAVSTMTPSAQKTGAS